MSLLTSVPSVPLLGAGQTAPAYLVLVDVFYFFSLFFTGRMHEEVPPLNDGVVSLKQLYEVTTVHLDT